MLFPVFGEHEADSCLRWWGNRDEANRKILDSGSGRFIARISITSEVGGNTGIGAGSRRLSKNRPSRARSGITKDDATGRYQDKVVHSLKALQFLVGQLPWSTSDRCFTYAGQLRRRGRGRQIHNDGCKAFRCSAAAAGAWAHAC